MIPMSKCICYHCLTLSNTKETSKIIKEKSNITKSLSSSNTLIEMEYDREFKGFRCIVKSPSNLAQIYISFKNFF